MNQVHSVQIKGALMLLLHCSMMLHRYVKHFIMHIYFNLFILTLFNFRVKKITIPLRIEDDPLLLIEKMNTDRRDDG
jgi:hypothetical protein